jgi:hypothetical protein
MRYFDTSRADDSFVVTASRLLDELGRAEPGLQRIGDARAGEPKAAGKWSRKQILGHLVDSAANNHQRFVRGQQGESLDRSGYAQEHWVQSQGWAQRPWPEIVGLWTAYNRHLAHVIARIPEDCSTLACTIGGQPWTLGDIARDYVAHLRHHLDQIFDGVD